MPLDNTIPPKPSESPADDTSGVPDDFQEQCSALLSSCTDPACLDYLEQQLEAKREELAPSDDAAKEAAPEAMPSKAAEFTTDDMP